MARKKTTLELDLKLDLGCGEVSEPGFKGVDIRRIPALGTAGGIDLGKAKWPWKDSSVSEARAVHLLQYLTSEERIHFANELYRVLKPGVKCTIVTPHWNGSRALQDPLAKWPAVCETAFVYWNAEWRKNNRVEHYGFDCDFDYGYAYSPMQPWGTKSEETRNFGFTHYANTIVDFHVNLFSRKK